MTPPPATPEFVPSTLDQLLDPEWLAPVLGLGPDEQIVQVSPVDSLVTVASKVRFQVTVEAADDTRRIHRYCAKGHFDGKPSSLMSETHFYRRLAPGLGLRVPAVSYTGIDDEARNWVIIMEDVVAAGGRFLSAHEPYSADTCRQTLDQLARLHALTWEDADLLRVDWLAPRMARMAERYSVEYLQALLDDGRAEGLARELRDGARVKEALLRTSAWPGRSVIHGDAHSGNVYLDPEQRACWIDWQNVQAGNWAIDVSYHMATTLDIEDRRAHERDLLQFYLRRLHDHGSIDVSWAEAWEGYVRAFSYGYFLWVITTISSREVVLIHMPRLAVALTDHETFLRLGVA